MKNKVLKLINDEINRCYDDLHRAKRAFLAVDLNEQHGASGKTRQQILSAYESAYSEAVEMRAWVENQ